MGAGFINVCGETRRLSHSVSDLSIGLHRVEKMGVIDVMNVEREGESALSGSAPEKISKITARDAIGNMVNTRADTQIFKIRFHEDAVQHRSFQHYACQTTAFSNAYLHQLLGHQERRCRFSSTSDWSCVADHAGQLTRSSVPYHPSPCSLCPCSHNLPCTPTGPSNFS